MRAKLFWGLMLLVGVLAGVALGAARPASPSIDQPLTVSGALTYIWHGDPSRGCAARGLCGARGSVIVRFDGFAQVNGRLAQGIVAIDSASATARVRREDPNAQPGECVDTIPLVGFAITLVRQHGRAFRANLGASQISGGRCAGPLADQLARLRLGAVRLGTRAIGFDLRGRVPFAAGPYSGELISTLVLRPDTTDQVGGGGTTVFASSSSSSASPSPRRRTRVLIEYVRFRYRVSGASGMIGADFAGTRPPDCEVLDSCATSGTVRLGTTPFAETITLTGSRAVTRAVGRRRALTDARAGRFLLYATPLLKPIGTTTTEAIVRTGGAGASCVDTTTARATLFAGVTGAGFARRGVLFALSDAGDGSDPLRTNCPGPTGADIAGSSSPFDFAPALLTSGVLAPRALGAPHTLITMRNAARFRSAGYTGTRVGALTISLALSSANTGTRREVVVR